MTAVERLYVKRKQIPLEEIKKIRETSDPNKPALVQNEKQKNFVNVNHRKCLIDNLDPKLYPVFSEELLKIAAMYPIDDINNYYVKEMQHLKYQAPGDHFRKHIDRTGKDVEITSTTRHDRIFSSSTILHKSDDLEGGEFLIWSKDGSVHTVELEVGDTLFFMSDYWHQILPINKGTRQVLVAWIWKR